MYSIDENTGPKVKYFEGGIHENVKITSISKENAKKDNTGSTVLRFYFEGEDGQLFNHTEFPIDPEHEKKMAEQWGNDPEEQLAQVIEDFNARIKHLLEAFIPSDQIKISAKDWEDYCDKVIALAGKNYEDELFRIKLILNKKDYPILPKKTYSPFIQSMNENSKITINPKYDRIVPQAPSEEALYDAPEDGGLGDETFEDEF